MNFLNNFFFFINLFKYKKYHWSLEYKYLKRMENLEYHKQSDDTKY